MIKPREDPLKITAKDMLLASLMAKGMSQSEAARRVEIPHAMVPRAIKKLEKAYGIKMGNGVKKGWALTEAGIALGKQLGGAMAIINADIDHPALAYYADNMGRADKIKKKALELIELAYE